MSTAGMRNWNCPECGREMQLPVTQLDPIACDECLAKRKIGHRSSAHPDLSNAGAGPLGFWQSLPETTKLFSVAAALLIGLLIGYIAGQATSPHSTKVSTNASSRAKDKEDVTSDEDPEDRPPAPGPGYKWVKGRTRSDGTRGPSHWVKDSHHKAD